MAYADLPVQNIVATGLEPALVAAVDDGGDGHQVVNNGRMFLLVKAGTTAGGSVNVTAKTPRTVEGLAVAEQVVNILDDTEKMIGPFPAATYNVLTGAASGKVQFDYDDTTQVTVVALVLP